MLSALLLTTGSVSGTLTLAACCTAFNWSVLATNSGVASVEQMEQMEQLPPPPNTKDHLCNLHSTDPSDFYEGGGRGTTLSSNFNVYTVSKKNM